MAPDPAVLRFYADESILGVGKALAIARTDLIHPGHALIPEVPLGTVDPVWMPEVAKRNMIVLSRDKRIRTKPAELAVFRDHGLRVFWIAGKRDLTSWGKLVRLVTHWEAMEAIVASRGPGPWFMAVNDRDITEIPMPVIS